MPFSSLPSTPLRVLVVEDEPLFAEQLEMVLNRLNYQVVGPAPDADAVRALLAPPAPLPDIVLLDINLRGSGPDGVELGRYLVEEHALPLIFLTSRADGESFARARSLGPAAYLVKPVDPPTLQRAIELAITNFSIRSRSLASGAQPAPAFEESSGEVSAFALPESGVLLPQALFLKENGFLVKVMLSEIVWVEAKEGGCRMMLTQGRTVTIRQVLRDLTPQLPAEQFVQIHRSYIINTEFIERIDPVRGIIQISGQLLPLSRSYRESLLPRLRQV